MPLRHDPPVLLSMAFWVPRFQQKGVAMPGSGSFNPEAITLLRGVLDEVWAEVEPLTHSGNQREVRKKLAKPSWQLLPALAQGTAHNSRRTLCSRRILF